MVQQNRPELLRAALDYSAAGLYVFPVRPNAKKPLAACAACHASRCPGPHECEHTGCHGHLDAVDDHGLIQWWWRRWPTANVGIACGPSRLAVVDLDGPAGIRQWQDLTGVRATARTLTARTPSGGAHLYYAANPERPMRNSVRELAADIDTRGSGGYVVAPPSIRRDGSYTWSTEPAELIRGLPVIPDWVLDALAPPPAAPVHPSIPAARLDNLTGRQAAYVRAAVDREVQRVLDATPGAARGGRNDSLNRAAFALGQLVGAGALDRVDAITALALAGEAVGLGGAEIERTVRSGLDAGTARPRRLPS